jgi:HEAT repeat protein
MEQVQAAVKTTDLVTDLEADRTTNLTTDLKTAIVQANWVQVCRFAEQGLLSQTLPESEVLNALLQALEWGDFQVRWDVAKILPKLGDLAIEPLLDLLQEDLLQEDGEELQWFVVRALGSWDSDQVMQALLGVLKSGHPELQSMAATVLAQYGDRVLALLKPIGLKPIGLPSDPMAPQPPILGEPEISKLWAARILANIRTIGTVELLLVLAMDADPEVGCTAIEALMSFQDDRKHQVLMDSLQSIHSSIRKTAVEAIGFCQGLTIDQRIDLLTPLLMDLNVSVSTKTAASLGRLGDRAAAPLLKTLNSSPLPHELEIELVRSLLRIASPTALMGLFDLAQQSVPVRHELLRSLGRVRDVNVKTICVRYLLDLMQTNLTLADRKLAVTALGHLEQPTAIEGLIAQFITPDLSLRLHILQALQQIDRTLEHPIVRTKILQQLQAASHPEMSGPWRSGLEFAIVEWR